MKKDPTVLDRIDAILFVETPLHVAASEGQELFAKEILRLKPSFGPKLNPDGLSSLHLALMNRKFDMVKVLVNLDRQLIRVKGKEGKTLLHLIVKNEDIDHFEADQQQRVEGSLNAGQQQGEDPRIIILAKLLFYYPNIIEDRTIRDETALHIAVKTKNIHAVEVILGFIRRTSTTWVLAARDIEGNTVLHMAVSNSQLQMVDILIQKFNRKDINTENSVTKETALDVAILLRTDEARLIEKSLRNAEAKTRRSSSANHDKIFAQFFSSPLWPSELLYKLYKKHPSSMDRRDMANLNRFAVMVYLLVAIATFRLALNLPGGAGGGDIDQVFRSGRYFSANVSSTNFQFTFNTSFINTTIFIPTDVRQACIQVFGWSIYNIHLSLPIIVAVVPFLFPAISMLTQMGNPVRAIALLIATLIMEVLPPTPHGESDFLTGDLITRHGVVFLLSVIGMISSTPVGRLHRTLSLLVLGCLSTFLLPATFGLPRLDIYNLLYSLLYAPLAYRGMTLWFEIFGLKGEVSLPTNPSPIRPHELQHLWMLKNLLRNFDGQ